MKLLVIFTTFFYLTVAGLVFAQNKPSAPPVLPQRPSPLIRQDQARGVGSNVHSLNLILRQQMRQVQKDRKSGKLTKAQTEAAWEKMKFIRQQELQYFKQNGEREITANQKNQLTTTLNQNAGSI